MPSSRLSTEAPSPYTKLNFCLSFAKSHENTSTGFSTIFGGYFGGEADLKHWHVRKLDDHTSRAADSAYFYAALSPHLPICGYTPWYNPNMKVR